MDNKFLDKVVDQIISETRINNDEVYTPFSSFSPHYSFFFDFTISPISIFPSSLSKHCKEIYSLNKEETEYVWGKYKEGIVLLMEKKELTYEY